MLRCLHSVRMSISTMKSSSSVSSWMGTLFNAASTPVSLFSVCREGEAGDGGGAMPLKTDIKHGSSSPSWCQRRTYQAEMTPRCSTIQLPIITSWPSFLIAMNPADHSHPFLLLAQALRCFHFHTPFHNVHTYAARSVCGRRRYKPCTDAAYIQVYTLYTFPNAPSPISPVLFHNSRGS